MMTTLEQLNAIVGLCYSMPGWPSSLVELGYKVERLELSFTITDEGKSITINPDLVLVSDRFNSSLIFENKSRGDLIDPVRNKEKEDEVKDQLSRSCKATKEDFIFKGAISTSDPTKHIHSLILLCNDEYKTFFEKVIAENNYEIAIISIGKNEIKLVLNKINEENANNVFEKGINIENLFPPVNIIPICPDSDQLEITKQVVNAIMALLVSDQRCIDITNIMSKIFYNGLWNVFDSRAKKELTRRVRGVLKEMCETEFSQYISRRGGYGHNPEEWTLLNHPSKTTQYQALKSTKIKYIGRKYSGEIYSNYNPQQETLFANFEKIEAENAIS